MFVCGTFFVLPTVNSVVKSTTCIVRKMMNLSPSDSHQGLIKLWQHDKPLFTLKFHFVLQIRAWLVAIGHSFGFGTVIAKLWRIYIIFK